MKNAHLYLLVDKEHGRFKIGLTTDLRDRAATLLRKCGDIDPADSYRVSDDLLSITALERTLQFIFRAWAMAGDCEQPGYTEWFDIACLDHVMQEIHRISRYQRVARTIIRGIPVTMGANVRLKAPSQIADILFPECRFRILRLFYLDPGVRHHVREVARLTNTFAGTVNKELRNLSKGGLLRSERVGNHVVYMANSSNVCFGEIRSLITKCWPPNNTEAVCELVDCAVTA